MKCPRCGTLTKEPPGEEGTHPCPKCGWDNAEIVACRVELSRLATELIVEIAKEASDEDICQTLGLLECSGERFLEAIQT